ncbi:MAG: hypothetical protein AB7M05_18915 [Alphaproteobacteria bacterium]
MHFDPSATFGELPAFFSRTIQSCGWNVWKRRFLILENSSAKNPLLGQFFGQRYPLEFEISALHRHYLATGRYPELHNSLQYSAYSFLAMFARVHQRLSPSGKKRLSGMLRSCLDTNSQYGLRPLQHEITVAAHLMRRGFDVQFTDIENQERFDFLAAKNDIEIEIECKTFGGDIGRPIHLRAFYALGIALFDELANLPHTHPGGHLVKITVFDRLHVRQEFLGRIKSAVSFAIRDNNKSFTSSDCGVEFAEFDAIGTFGIVDANKGISASDVKDLVEKRFRAINKNILVILSPPNGMTILVVESHQSDDVVPSMYRALREAARQCSGGRAAVLCARLTDITEEQLRSLAKRNELDKPTGLDVIAGRLFRHEEKSYVHSVAFMTDGALQKGKFFEGDRLIDSLKQDGPAWVLTNKRSKVADDRQYQIFV